MRLAAAIFALCLSISIHAQTDSIFTEKQKPKFDFSGQLSSWFQYAPDVKPNFYWGARAIPEIEFSVPLKKKRLIDFELSANLYGEWSFPRGEISGKIKPYRAWARFSDEKMEIRLGLQKLNFGSAMIFRPLMWFDQIDPRDPLQMTDGVYAALFKYYFKNNANLWIWALALNENTKGWDIFPTGEKPMRPELGGRFQYPVPKGEIAFSANGRRATTKGFAMENLLNYRGDFWETKIGFDARFNLEVGLWLETSWTHTGREIAVPMADYFLSNQLMTTIGADYTFGIGNGLAITAEHLIYAMGSQKSFEKAVNFTALSLSYPFTIFDKLSAMLYYSWDDRQVYSFIDWQHTLNSFEFHLMGYWNPMTMSLPSLSGNAARFQGKGLQALVVWNF